MYYTICFVQNDSRLYDENGGNYSHISSAFFHETIRIRMLQYVIILPGSCSILLLTKNLPVCVVYPPYHLLYDRHNIINIFHLEL
jgi:hypothetical protein